MREMKDSGVDWIWEIPKDWKMIPGKFLLIHSKTIVGDREREFERLALTLQGVIKRPKEDSDGLQPQTFTTYQILKKGDLVFKLIDLENIATSRVGLSPFDGLVSPAYIVVTPTPERSHGPFLHYFYRMMWNNQIFNTLGDVGVRSSLNSSDLLSIKVPYPSFSEQIRIASYLDSKCSQIDTIIEKTQQEIEKLKEYRQSLITEVVTKGLNPDAEMKNSGFDFIGSIPAHWEVCKLRHIGQLQNGISKSGDFFGHGYPFVAYGDVYKNYSLPKTVTGLLESTQEERDQYSVEYGDIFFTRTSETIEEVGFSSVCEQTIPDATFAGFLIRLRPTTDKVSAGYAKYYFRSQHQRKYLVKEMNLVTRASLGQTLLKGMPVLIPPRSEQDSISAYLELKCGLIEEIVSDKQWTVDKLQQYKKSLIYECVTGKREVPTDA